MTNTELFAELIDKIREVNDTLYYLARNNILPMSETLAILNLLKVTDMNKNIIKDNFEKSIGRTVKELESD